MSHAAVIGWPVSQSRSPLIHGHWLKQFDIKGDYGRGRWETRPQAAA